MSAGVLRLQAVAANLHASRRWCLAELDPHSIRHRAERSVAIDVFKGFAILSVVGIHVTGHFARRFSLGSPAWAADIVCNQLLQFAVPAFLIVCAWLIGRKLYALPVRDRFAASWRRLPRILAIYFAASLLFFADSARHNHSVANLAYIANALLWGKASFHLYFLVVLMQMIAILPLATAIVRPDWSLSRLVAVAGLLQLGLYAANHFGHPAAYPGTLIGWYVLPCMLGVWLASRGEQISFSRATTTRLYWVTLMAATAYLPFAVGSAAGDQVDSFAFQTTNWCYASVAALWVLTLAQRLSVKWPPSPLAAIGRSSLAIYILHPLAIELLDHLMRTATHLPTAAAMPLYVATCVGLPLLAAGVWRVVSAPSRPTARTQTRPCRPSTDG